MWKAAQAPSTATVESIRVPSISYREIHSIPVHRGIVSNANQEEQELEKIAIAIFVLS